MMDELWAGDGRFIRPDPMIAWHDTFFCCLLLLPSSVALGLTGLARQAVFLLTILLSLAD